MTESGSTRLAFGRDNTLYVTVSGIDPQDPKTHGGKVLRLRDDGSIPPDNPFVGRADAKPEVYTLGHRNSLGLACIRAPEKCGRTRTVRTAATRSMF